jgi:hypothetical protein
LIFSKLIWDWYKTWSQEKFSRTQLGRLAAAQFKQSFLNGGTLGWSRPSGLDNNHLHLEASAPEAPQRLKPPLAAILDAALKRCSTQKPRLKSRAPTTGSENIQATEKLEADG